MARKPFDDYCKNCSKIYSKIDSRQLFCSRSCSGKYNNKGKTLSKETKHKISRKLKERFSSEESRNKQSIKVGKTTKGKYKNPSSLLDLSTRTISKIIKRLNLSCSRCGWDKSIGDIHHINGRKVDDCNNHLNLTYICPNCHREFHNGVYDKSELINLKDYIGDKWKEYYYG